MQDETTADDTTADGASAPRWKPLSAIERRVLGVLIEKAKTTPENYPLSLNAIRVGSNQKSNRSPQMQLPEEDVQEALDTLREQGAVAQIQGDGRVEKYRHLAYDWLGVEKLELSVIGELLLRGDQTVGELRGRAARMDTIADLAELRPLLASLHEKGLLVYLTPQGRGCTVTHALYQPQQLDKLRAQYGTGSSGTGSSGTGSSGTGSSGTGDSGASPSTASPSTASPSMASPPAAPSPSTTSTSHATEDGDLRGQVARLQAEVKELKKDVAAIAALVREDTPS